MPQSQSAEKNINSKKRGKYNLGHKKVPNEQIEQINTKIQKFFEELQETNIKNLNDL